VAVRGGLRPAQSSRRFSSRYRIPLLEVTDLRVDRMWRLRGPDECTVARLAKELHGRRNQVVPRASRSDEIVAQHGK